MRNTKKFILIPLGIVAFSALIGFVVMQLWNCLLPDIIHANPINFWQAIGLFVLCKILFGFGRGGGKMGGAPWMRGRMEERMKNMSPEERERFRNEIGNRCGWKRNRGDRGGFNRDFFNTEKETGNEAPKTDV